MTGAERRLWTVLRLRQMDGAKFRRQEPIGPYIVDFCCHEARLVVEVDGGQHAELVADADRARDVWLRSQGYEVLRFWNHEVIGHLEGVHDRIVETLHGRLRTGRLPPP